MASELCLEPEVCSPVEFQAGTVNYKTNKGIVYLVYKCVRFKKLALPLPHEKQDVRLSPSELYFLIPSPGPGLANLKATVTSENSQWPGLRTETSELLLLSE